MASVVRHCGGGGGGGNGGGGGGRVEYNNCSSKWMDALF